MNAPWDQRNWNIMSAASPAGASSTMFTNIPDTYSHLMFIGNVASTSGSPSDHGRMRLGTAGTSVSILASDYEFTYAYCKMDAYQVDNSYNTGSYDYFWMYFGANVWTNSHDDTYSFWRAVIPNYTQTGASLYFPVTCEYAVPDDGVTSGTSNSVLGWISGEFKASGLYTNPINAVEFSLENGNFETGSQITMFGLT